MEIMIFGAKSLALGACKALQELHKEHSIGGFLVTSLEGNTEVLNGLPVMELSKFADSLTDAKKQEICIFVGTPEDVHPVIVESIKVCGFSNIVCMDSRMEAKLMEQYFKEIKRFPSVHELEAEGELPSIEIFMIKFYKDKVLKSSETFADWVYPIQVGADLTDIRVAEFLDNTGDNISAKNKNYCETTAFYWLWKNRLKDSNDKTEYYGFYHYRRVLDISKDDLKRIRHEDVDVILQYPTLHEPDIKEHHARYVEEKDWDILLRVMKELYPEYREAYEDIFSQEYFYNYNLIIAKREVLREYCEWLFPILEKTGQLSEPKEWEREDRYLAYMSESLMTLYFFYNQDRLKIYHTGRFMLT